MDTSLMLSPSSVNANKTIESSYKLALKQFMNKNLAKSFTLIHQLYQSCFAEYAKSSISENLLIKIINLYLIEVGVGIKEGKFDKANRTLALNSITSNELINQVKSVYETVIPSEILYNYHLVHISNQELLITDKHSYLSELKSNYMKVTGEGKYDRKFMQLVVFEILPTFDEFTAAQNILSINPMFDAQDYAKLMDIQSNKAEIVQQEKLKQQELKRLEQEEKEKELEKQRQLQKDSNIKYKSIKEIQKQYASESAKPNVGTVASGNKLTELRDKLWYLTNLLKIYVKDNSLIIIVVLILLFVSKRFINTKKINLKDKIVDTVKMAFKFSYV
ncbi:uncharacterized protein SPAPADRAFT_62548 [Spathaspora passalidarum NRRL Y-27907]|uniref:Uncharacterized protein n=1 Tax=Spathaspora passalidarum (strain NRRL Y-27907 / 11-Y1) TaxID=619300 RepID=G3ASJ4_SPAPN|nr:uncharacterized protein SPAPADRAFT_62548 [Spathaspora passalidarum NRRL Y-27907]EGW30680.1 hypothetical protein SPAPADRAFT_62548 [Spathaspora passalidarum NRRL Y-27907]